MRAAFALAMLLLAACGPHPNCDDPVGIWDRVFDGTNWLDPKTGPVDRLVFGMDVCRDVGATRTIGEYDESDHIDLRFAKWSGRMNVTNCVLTPDPYGGHCRNLVVGDVTSLFQPRY